MKKPYLFLGLLFAALFAGAATPARAQIAIQIGPPPVCPYGYFDYPPYDCAPYGYYGPEWFPNGVFVGAGPWYRGRDRFWGHVDNHYDRYDGYRGEYPRRGERFDDRIATTATNVGTEMKCATATATRTSGASTNTATATMIIIATKP